LDAWEARMAGETADEKVADQLTKFLATYLRVKS
jgi:hypothetical protein